MTFGKTAAAFLLAAIPFCTYGSDLEANTLNIRPIGTLLLDGAFYSPCSETFANGVAIPDVRIGLVADYGPWQAKVDVGYAFGKVSLKDVFIRYSSDPRNRFFLGYITPEFGINASVSSAMRPTMEELPSDQFFNRTTRQLTLMYAYSGSRVSTAISGFVDRKSLTTHANRQGKSSIGVANRTFLLPLVSSTSVIQAGISALYQTPLHSRDSVGAPASPGYFDLSASFPTRVCDVGMLQADVTRARGLVRISPELLLLHRRFALTSQYYYTSIARTGSLSSYSAKGAYVVARALLRGSSYTYDHSQGDIASPAPGSLELTAAFDYIDACSEKADIFGGISRDASVTLSYHINHYMLARIRYSYTDVSDRKPLPDLHVNSIQARLQIKF